MIPLRISQFAEDGLIRIAEFAASSTPTDLEIRQVVMGCATIMETYVDAVIQCLVQESAIASSSVGAAMVEEFQGDFSRNWSRRNHWFSVVTGVSFKGAQYGQNAWLLVDLRNALAHGSGGLSRLQTGESDGGVKLRGDFAKKLHVEMVGGTLFPTNATAKAATSISRVFVLALDEVFLTGRLATAAAD